MRWISSLESHFKACQMCSLSCPTMLGVLPSPTPSQVTLSTSGLDAALCSAVGHAGLLETGVQGRGVCRCGHRV